MWHRKRCFLRRGKKENGSQRTVYIIMVLMQTLILPMGVAGFMTPLHNLQAPTTIRPVLHRNREWCRVCTDVGLARKDDGKSEYESYEASGGGVKAVVGGLTTLVNKVMRRDNEVQDIEQDRPPLVIT